MSSEPVENNTTPAVVQEQQPINNTVEQTQPQQPKTISLNYTEELDKIKDIASTYLLQQTQPIIIPTYSKWFNIDTIHEIEIEFFKEFFNETDYSFKNSRTYKDCRDFMVNTYRLHPLEYLTITAVRRNLNLDIQSIIKIHQFLEKWGIINYQIDPRTRPSIMAPGYTGHFNVVLDTPRGLKMFIPEGVEVRDTKEDENGGEQKYELKRDYKLPLQENKYCKSDDYLTNSLNKKDPISKIKYVCQTCGVDCDNIVYHNLRDKSSNVCVSCFKEAKFLTIYSSSDFLRLNLNEDSIDENDWSSSDIFKLLEGIEMFENDWTKIAKYTNKTKEQCVMKFLTLPIEDDHFNKVVTETEKTKNQNGYDFEEFLQKVLASLNDENKNKIIENSNLISQKYINETNVIIQELTKNKLEAINLKLEKIDNLEKKYTTVVSEYEARMKKLALAEQKFEQKLKHVNDKLKQQGINEEIVLEDETENNEEADVENVIKVEKTHNSEKKEDVDMKVDEVESNGSGEKKSNGIVEKKVEYKIWAL